MPDYKGFYEGRVTELELSFGSGGHDSEHLPENSEHLAENRQLWMTNNLQRVYGPANRVLPLKRSMEED